MRDATNESRLLGYLNNPPSFIFDGRVFKMAVLPHLSVRAPVLPAEPLTMRSVEFERRWRFERGGYIQRAFLATQASLDDLLSMQEFTLPGESPTQAAERRYRS